MDDGSCTSFPDSSSFSISLSDFGYCSADNSLHETGPDTIAPDNDLDEIVRLLEEGEEMPRCGSFSSPARLSLGSHWHEFPLPAAHAFFTSTPKRSRGETASFRPRAPSGRCDSPVFAFSPTHAPESPCEPPTHLLDSQDEKGHNEPSSTSSSICVEETAGLEWDDYKELLLADPQGSPSSSSCKTHSMFVDDSLFEDDFHTHLASCLSAPDVQESPEVCTVTAMGALKSVAVVAATPRPPALRRTHSHSPNRETETQTPSSSGKEKNVRDAAVNTEPEAAETEGPWASWSLSRSSLLGLLVGVAAAFLVRVFVLGISAPANNWKRTFRVQLEYVHGPPPT